MTHDKSIETERLVLRLHHAEDLDDMYEMWSNPAVTRYTSRRIFSREDVWERLLRYAGTWALFGCGFWVIREKETSDFVGEVGFHNLRREMTSPFGDRPELGFALTPRARGRAFATEAARAAL